MPDRPANFTHFLLVLQVRERMSASDRLWWTNPASSLLRALVRTENAGFQTLRGALCGALRIVLLLFLRRAFNSVVTVSDYFFMPK